MVGNALAVVLAVGMPLLVAPSACTANKRSVRTLAAAGYTGITITGWRPFMSKGDWFSTGFKARGIDGRTVTGSVTGGLLFGGFTIRYD